MRTTKGSAPWRLATVWLLALATFCSAAAQKRKPPPPPPAVQILEIVARRSDGLITIDGRLRNIGSRPLEGLELVLDFTASDGLVITRQRGAIEPDPLDPGEEAEFGWKMRDHARAVSLRIRALDRKESELPVKNAGPHFIE